MKTELGEHASQAEARARAIFEASNEAIGVSNNGVHVQVNAAYARLFGFSSPFELVGLPISSVVHESDQQRVREIMTRRARGEPAPTRYQVKARRRDGSPLEIEVQLSPFGKPESLNVVVVVRDVTEQRKFESQLAASEHRLRMMCHQMPVGVWELDLSGARDVVDELRAAGVQDLVAHFGAHPVDSLRCLRTMRVLSANPSACALVEANDEPQLLASMHRFIPPESVSAFTLLFSQFAEGMKRVAAIEAWMRTLKGGRCWVSLTVTPVSGHERDWARVLVTTTDLTERERLREELRHGEKLEAIGRLAGGVAHDFNNLLCTILASSDVALMELPRDSSLTEPLALIREASLRAKDLVQQILTFGRKDKPRLIPLDLSTAVSSALGLARAALPAVIQLDSQIEPEVGTVLADHTQLNRVIMNLCSNARDALLPRGGQVLVSLERVGRQARLRVKDDGAGMDEAIRARLFEPYLTTKPNGHGLGLAVVHGIVAGLGGTIHVESARGEGTCFEVYLPLSNVAAIPEAPKIAQCGEHERLLLVDDQPLVRAGLSRLLSSLGYIVSEAADGQEALERLRAGPGEFDLVISDQTMPRLSGLELAKALRADGSRMPIILCSGFSEVLDEQNALRVGVSGVLAKPIDRTSMAAAVRRALG